MTKAFLTGSRAYGAPHRNSDIDMVVRVDDAELLKALDAEADRVGGSDPGDGGVTIRFGKLNLLLCTTDEAYRTWEEGTELLKDVKPVTRKQAMKVFDRLRNKPANKEA